MRGYWLDGAVGALAALVVLVVGLSDPVSAGVLGNMELGFDRPGGDLQRFAVPDSDPASCAAACASNGQCRTWTFVKPGVLGQQALCLFKGGNTAPVANGCCISGAIQAASAPPPPPSGANFPIPVANGERVDWCVTFGANCGQGGADQFCRTQNYAGAAAWSSEIVARTFVIGSSQFCERAAGCGALRDVTCSNSGQTGGGSGPIAVIQATYGANCGAPAGNVTAHLRAACDGKSVCDYTIDYGVIGDPAPGCGKDYIADWSCGGVPAHATVDAEAGFSKVVHIVCPAR